MKKTLTLLALGLFAISASAQRSIDLEVSEILEPTVLNSEIVNNQPTTGLSLKFVVRNNGTDSLLAGDTILWQVTIRDKATSQVLVKSPTNGYYLIIVQKTMAPTDTLHAGITGNMGVALNISRNVEVIVAAAALNRTNPIAAESTADQANNVEVKEVIWYNPQGWNVSVDDVSFNDNLNVYPTLADDVINVSVLASSLTNVKIEMYDMQGRVVMTETNSSLFDSNAFELNTSSIPEGMYIIKVYTGEAVNTAKVQIRH